MVRSRPPRIAEPATVTKKRSRSPEAIPLRVSKRPSRTSIAKSTPQKSIYREVDSDDSESVAEAATEESGYEDEGDYDASTAQEDEGEESEDDGFDSEEEEEDETPKRRKSKAQSSGKTTSNKATNGSAVKNTKQDLWRQGVRVEGEGEVIIALPRARSPGKTPYRDDTLHPNTFHFLADLKKNNEREWLKLHDKDFRQSEKDWKSFVEVLTEKLIEKDETIPELPFKDVVFRIYRDVRFSPDQTPYKPHFSAAFSRTGRKGEYAKYYIQIAPGKSFVGGGLWCPDAPAIAMLRGAVDTTPDRLKKLLLDPGIRKNFLGESAKDEKKAVKAFCSHNAENALKKHPKGYDSSHPEIDLLRLRNWTMGKKLKDEEILGPKGMSVVAELFGAMTPFITYLNNVVMPDPGQGGDGNAGGDSSDLSESE